MFLHTDGLHLHRSLSHVFFLTAQKQPKIQSPVHTHPSYNMNKATSDLHVHTSGVNSVCQLLSVLLQTAKQDGRYKEDSHEYSTMGGMCFCHALDHVILYTSPLLQLHLPSLLDLPVYRCLQMP